MQAGKTIAAKRERLEADSERERARKVIRKKKVMAILAVVLLAGVLLFLAFKAFQEWVKWASTREEVIIVEKEPSVDVIDEATSKNAELSTRVKEYIANLEEEFAILGRKVTKAHIPMNKVREIDVEIDGFSGLIKISLDRNPAVSAEDAVRMLDYLAGQGINGCEYIDVRVERKGYWK